MKTTVTFRNSDLKFAFRKIPAIKLYRAVTKCGLREAKDAIDHMIDIGSNQVTFDTLDTKADILRKALVDGLDITVTGDSVVEGTFVFRKDGLVYFNAIISGESFACSTVKKSAGGVLNTILMTSALENVKTTRQSPNKSKKVKAKKQRKKALRVLLRKQLKAIQDQRKRTRVIREERFRREREQRERFESQYQRPSFADLF